MRLVITNKQNGVTSTTPYVVSVEKGENGLFVATELPTQRGEPRVEFLKWDDALTYELRKG